MASFCLCYSFTVFKFTTMNATICIEKIQPIFFIATYYRNIIKALFEINNNNKKIKEKKINISNKIF